MFLEEMMLEARIDASLKLVLGALDEIDQKFSKKPNVELVRSKLADSEKNPSPALRRLMECFRKVVENTPADADTKRVRDALILLLPGDRPTS
jgi:hypothetical protein